jgi:adenylate kinase
MLRCEYNAMILAISGVPGTGKTTLSKKLSEKLGWPLISANGIVKKKKLYSGKEKGSFVVNMKKLAREISYGLKGKKNAILEGHLLCDLKFNADAIVILRTNPTALEKRLKARGYPKGKVDENILSEALDYCTLNAEENFHEVYEIDTTKSKAQSMRQLQSIVDGNGEKLLSGKISWGRELEKLASELI